MSDLVVESHSWKRKSEKEHQRFSVIGGGGKYYTLDSPILPSHIHNLTVLYPIIPYL